MAQQFIEPPAGTTLTAAEALNNLRAGFMVDRFTGAAVDRGIAAQADDVTAVFGTDNTPVINLTALRNVTAVGSYHITDRIIVLTPTFADTSTNDAALIANANGVHISFYNCSFIVQEYDDTATTQFRFAWGVTPLATDGAGRTTSARVADGAANTRSINFYGCTVAQGSRATGRGNLRTQTGDAIGTDFRFSGSNGETGNTSIFPSPQIGSRWINSNFVTGQQRSNASVIFTYGFPDVFDTVELYGLGFNIGLAANDAAGPKMLLEPNFSFPGQNVLFDYQTFTAPGFGNFSNCFQNVGFFTPRNNTNNDASNVITGRGGTGYMAIQNGTGSVLNYAAYQPTYRDAVTGAGLENVRVRVNSSITLGNPGQAPTTANWGTTLAVTDLDPDITGNFYGNEYVTDTDGQLVSSVYTRTGWGTSLAGYFDPLEFRERTAVGNAQLAENTLPAESLTPPEHTAIAVIQYMRGQVASDGSLQASAFQRHMVQYQAFSWSHAVFLEQVESSTTLADGTARATQTAYGIQRDIGETAPSVIGTFVKPGFTTSVNTPNTTALNALFPSPATTVSINDIRMAVRRERYEYNILGNPQTTRMNLTLSPALTTPYTVGALTGGNYGVVVRANALEAKADDLYTGDPFLGTVNVAGAPITGLTLGDANTVWEGLRTSANLYATQGGAISGTYTSATGGDIFFDGTDVSGLNLVVTSGTLNIYGTAPDGTRLQASDFASITGNRLFPIIPIVNTLAIPAPTNGRYAITRTPSGLTTETELVPPTDIVAGTPINYDFDSTTFSEGDVVNLYYKFDSDIAGGSIFQEAVASIAFDATMNVTHPIPGPTPVVDILINQAEAPPAAVTFTGVIDASGDALFTVSGATATGTPLNRFQSQGLAIQIANDNAYFDAWYGNRADTTTLMLQYPVAAAQWDDTRITFQSGDTIDFTQGAETVQIPAQQQGEDWSAADTMSGGTLYRSRGGVPELNFPASQSAPLPSVIDAAGRALDARLLTRPNVRRIGLNIPVDES